jgi:hypothetical protein
MVRRAEAIMLPTIAMAIWVAVMARVCETVACWLAWATWDAAAAYISHDVNVALKKQTV